MIYTLPQFTVSDKEIELKFIDEFSFATIISAKGNEVKQLTKIPLLLKRGENLKLEGHMARNNTHLAYLQDNPKVTIIFDGPHGYISPTHYSDPSKNVPTWNFSSVIASGNAELIGSGEWLLSSVMEMADKFESNNDWKEQVDNDYIEQLSKGIVGVSIDVEEIASKFKLGQNKASKEREKVINSLPDSSRDLADQMRLFN